MLIENYPFIVTRPGDLARPYLPIIIINPENQKQLNAYALIDTGADECALPASFAPLLGHNLQSGSIKRVCTENGISIAYSHTICLTVFNFTSDNVLVDFMPNLHIPLLGVKNFLNRFVLKIDYPNKKFSIL
jgi:predicted aspartyl protease